MHKWKLTYGRLSYLSVLYFWFFNVLLVADPVNFDAIQKIDADPDPSILCELIAMDILQTKSLKQCCGQVRLQDFDNSDPDLDPI